MKRRDSAHMATARGDIRGCDAASRTKSHACQFELNACAVITQSLQTERSELERVFAGKRSNLEYDCVSLLRRALEPSFPGCRSRGQPEIGARLFTHHSAGDATIGAPPPE